MDAHVGTISLEYAKCTLYTPSLRSVMSNPTPDSGNDTTHEQPTEAVPPPPDHPTDVTAPLPPPNTWQQPQGQRSEEHTSELQSRGHLVCRLLLEKKKRE